MLDKINVGLELICIIAIFIGLAILICWIQGFALLWTIHLFISGLKITFWKSVGAGLALGIVASAFKVVADK